MKENVDYMTDFSLSQPCVLRMESVHEQAQDTAQRLASENVEQLSEIDEQRKANDELWKEFSQKQQELQQLNDAYLAKKAAFSKEALVNIMKSKCAELNTESQQIQKAFKKGELGIEDYTSNYRKCR